MARKSHRGPGGFALQSTLSRIDKRRGIIRNDLGRQNFRRVIKRRVTSLRRHLEGLNREVMSNPSGLEIYFLKGKPVLACLRKERASSSPIILPKCWQAKEAYSSSGLLKTNILPWLLGAHFR